jgi:ABC-type Fe3+/spermidine/putrescine transport system ATPase subunit
MDGFLILDSIRKSWGDFSLDVSFSAQEGEFLCILGPSGAGKSSLLRIIAGLEAPEAGRLSIGGRDAGDLPPEKRGVGMVFQDLALFPHYSVGGNVAYGLRAAGLRGRALQIRVEEALADLGLAGFSRRRVESLSGGERQRVALARSLALRPGILLLDEPLSSLDRPLRRRLRLDVRACLKAAGILAILVTHDREEAFQMADRILIMRAGRILDSGSPEELRAGGSHPFTGEFMGDEP